MIHCNVAIVRRYITLGGVYDGSEASPVGQVTLFVAVCDTLAAVAAA